MPSHTGRPGRSVLRARASRNLSVSSLLLPLLLALPAAHAAAPHCGTGILMSKRPEARTLPGGAKVGARTRAQDPAPVRMLETEHFRVRYVMRGLDRVKTVAEDAALVALADSLFAASAPLGDKVDSAVYAALDARRAPHPRYVSVMAGIFEAAWRYYVDTLGMRAPRETGASVYYRGAAHPQGKYPVDVANIGTADTEYRNLEIYALTYPTGSGGMLIENDFLYRATRLDTNGIPVGTPISSRYQGRLIHDYAAEWELGLKVTGYHELYHTVQFAYTAITGDFHVWYETSATGMEERKAPEVDDYLQYLPDYMSDVGTRGILALPSGGLSRYGNAIFHVFLTEDLGEDFDVHLWTRLSANGNDLRDALATTFARYGTNSQEVMARFAAQLAFSGTTARNPLPAFSPDLPKWPRLPRQGAVDLVSQGTFRYAEELPPMSVGAFGIAGTGETGKAVFLPDTLLRATVVRLGPETSAVLFDRNRIVVLDVPAVGEEGVVAVSNGTLSGKTALPFEVRPLTSRGDTVVYAYPNPMARDFGELLFSRVGRASRVEVFSETGRPLRGLDFPVEDDLWSWDLEAEDGVRVQPGLYYYRVDGGPLKPVFLR